VRVTVLGESSSPEQGHKVKLMGVMVSQVAGWLVGTHQDTLMTILFNQRGGSGAVVGNDEDLN
jgi:hypothetical protein